MADWNFLLISIYAYMMIYPFNYIHNQLPKQLNLLRMIVIMYIIFYFLTF